MINGLKPFATVSLISTFMANVAMAGNKPEDNYLQPQQVPIFKDMTLEEYKQAFTAKPVSYAVPLIGKAGPLVIEKTHWWKPFNEKEGPQLQLELKLPRVANLATDVNIGTVEISYVLGRDGYNYYDKAHSNETSDFMKNIKFSTPRIWGDNIKDEDIKSALNEPMKMTRNIRLLKGSKEENIVGVGGTINLRLPTEVEVFNFLVQDVGIEKKTAAGGTVKLNSAEGKKIGISFDGNKTDLLRFVAFKDGKALVSDSWSSSSFMGKLNQVMSFKDEPDEILVYVAKNIEEISYPFRIGQRPKKRKKTN